MVAAHKIWKRRKVYILYKRGIGALYKLCAPSTTPHSSFLTPHSSLTKVFHFHDTHQLSLLVGIMEVKSLLELMAFRSRNRSYEIF